MKYSFRAGRFTAELVTDFPGVIDTVKAIYPEVAQDYPIDFHLRLTKHRWWKPQARFFMNGLEAFSPLPASQAYPMLEWGLNWCVSQHAHQYLIIHSAVLVKENACILLPGVPGAGKSTLTALLVEKGNFRLLSDELALICPRSLRVSANPRPISLKNDSIEVVKKLVDPSRLTTKVSDTLKGTVAHLLPNAQSQLHWHKSYPITHIVFPQFKGKGPKLVHERKVGETVVALANHSFNYNIHGIDGFNTLCRVANESALFDFYYDGDLDFALRQFEQWVKA